MNPRLTANVHKITDKKINYMQDHDKELLSQSMKNSDDIARDNLNQLDGLLNINGG